MAKKVSPKLVNLIYDALLKCFWRKEALKRFLRASHISSNIISQLDMSESKRTWLDRLFPLLADAAKGPDLLMDMARELSAMKDFPDLMSYEDSDFKLQQARDAVSSLAKMLGAEKEEADKERDAEDARKRSRQMREVAVREREDLEKLKSRLSELAKAIGTQKGGYGFEAWFYDFLGYEEIDNRRPYKVDGRQIDGSITLDGTTYLVELKFEAKQAAATDIDSMKSKVNSKADNTMGVMIAMSGYSSVAISEASGAKTARLLLDYTHVMMVLEGMCTFKDCIRRVRRHSSQTGYAYLATNDFGG